MSISYMVSTYIYIYATAYNTVLNLTYRLLYVHKQVLLQYLYFIYAMNFS